MIIKKLILLTILFQSISTFGQTGVWSSWGKISCYQGLEGACINNGYVSSINSYSWNVRIKNNYSKKAHINFYYSIGGEKISVGLVSIEPGDIYTFTSLYVKNNSTKWHITVENVCFANSWGGCGSNSVNEMCFADCDNGRPNIPTNCGAGKSNTNISANSTNNNDSTIGSSNSNNSSNQTSQTQPKNDLTEYNRSKADLERQMQQKNQEIANKYQQYSNAFNAGVSAHNSGNYAEAKTQFTNAIGFSNTQEERAKAQDYLNKSAKTNKDIETINTVSTTVQETLSGIDAIIQANKENKERKIKDDLAKDLAVRQIITDANNGIYDAQIKVAEKYFTESKYDLAESFYLKAMKNPSANDYQKNSILDEIITTQSLQDKKKDIFLLIKYFNDNKINNLEVEQLIIKLKLFCTDYSSEFFDCNENQIIQGVDDLKKQKEFSDMKIVYSYFQVTGDLEKYGITKNEKDGLITLNEMATKKLSNNNNEAYYFLGMIFLNGTSTIEANEKEALKYFLKGYDGKDKEMYLLPAYSKQKANQAYFNYRLLTYIKIAGLYSKSKNKNDREKAETMFKRFYKWYKGMIPNSDKKYFKEFTSITTIAKTVIPIEPISNEKYIGEYEYLANLSKNIPFKAKLLMDANINSKEIYICPETADIYVINNTNENFSKVYIDGYTGFLPKNMLKRKN